MRKINKIKDKAIFKSRIHDFPEDKQDIIEEYLETLPLNWSESKVYGRFLCFCDIIETNFEKSKEEYINLYEEYWAKGCKAARKLLIRHGHEKHDIYLEKMKNRKLRDYTNYLGNFSKQFWIEKRGYTEDEAAIKVKEIHNRTIETYYKNKKENPEKYKDRGPTTNGYWTRRGYSLEEAEIQRRPYNEKCSRTLERFIKRYGEELGTKKFHEANNKRNDTMIKRYGTLVVGCPTSRESLKFFVPLYKRIRKLGIKKEDIFWSIKGNTEFATHHEGKNYFYDFVIKSLNYVIEYNNEQWHPHPLRKWKGFIDYNDALVYDEKKLNAIRLRGFEVRVVWNFEDLKERQNELFLEIERLYDECIS